MGDQEIAEERVIKQDSELNSLHRETDEQLRRHNVRDIMEEILRLNSELDALQDARDAKLRDYNIVEKQNLKEVELAEDFVKSLEAEIAQMLRDGKSAKELEAVVNQKRDTNIRIELLNRSLMETYRIKVAILREYELRENTVRELMTKLITKYIM